MDQMNQPVSAIKSYEKIYGKMNRAKAYGSVSLLAACTVMCVVEPIFLGFIAFPLFMGVIAPDGMRDLKREFSKEGNLLRDAFGVIAKDVRTGIRNLFGAARKAGVAEAAAVSQPVEQAGVLAAKSSRADFERGQDAALEIAIEKEQPAPANANAPAARKHVA